MDFQVGFYDTKLFGMVDELEDGKYVATLFHHIFGVPIVFQGTYLILGLYENKFTGIKLPLSWKSILFAYLRTALFVPMIGGIMAGIVAFQDRSWGEAGFSVAAIVLASLGFVATYKIGTANPSRKRELARLAKNMAESH